MGGFFVDFEAVTASRDHSGLARPVLRAGPQGWVQRAWLPRRGRSDAPEPRICSDAGQRAERGAKLERASACKTLAINRYPLDCLSPGRLPVGRLVIVRPTPSVAVPRRPPSRQRGKGSPSLNA